MKPTSRRKPLTLNATNITEIVTDELLRRGDWDRVMIMRAWEALGNRVQAPPYNDHDCKVALSCLIIEAMEAHILQHKDDYCPDHRGRLPWRRLWLEWWSAGTVDEDCAYTIVCEHMAALAAKIRPVKPAPQKGMAAGGCHNNEPWFSWEHSTVIAMWKALEWMGRRGIDQLNGRALGSPEVNRIVNEFIRAAAAGVVHYNPKHALGFREPFVFEARAETVEERETRLMLECLCR